MNEWSREEQELLAKLPREAAPPPDLERRLAAKLFHPPRRIWWRYAAAAAVAIVLVGLAFTAGRRSVASRPEGRAYLLLLRRSGPTTPAQVQEYREWARTARERGALISGAKLTTSGQTITPDGQVVNRSFEQDGEIGGFFMIQAPDLDAATRLALGTPHLRYGGSIELRPIEQ